MNGGLISRWAYKRNKKNVLERLDKTYLRNELIKLTYHFILSYIYNTFIVRHNKRRTYFQKLTYKTDLCDWNNWNFDVFKKEMQKEHTYTVDGLINGGGLISGWSYIRNYVFIGNWMGLYPGGLKTGGALKWDFACTDWTLWFGKRFRPGIFLKKPRAIVTITLSARDFCFFIADFFVIFFRLDDFLHILFSQAQIFWILEAIHLIHKAWNEHGVEAF